MVTQSFWEVKYYETGGEVHFSPYKRKVLLLGFYGGCGDGMSQAIDIERKVVI